MGGYVRLGGGSRLGLEDKELYKMIAQYLEKAYLNQPSLAFNVV